MSERRTRALFIVAAALIPTGITAAVCVGEAAPPPSGSGTEPVVVAGAQTGQVGAVAVPAAAAVPVADEDAPDPQGPALTGVKEASGRMAYGGNPDRESALVVAEDQRLTQVRSFATASRWSKQPIVFPYELASGGRRTLVLTERKAPYTAAELVRLAPQGFVQTAPGVYLLTDHLVVLAGATLHLGGTGPVTIRLASDAAGFASIVNEGGRLEIVGTPAAPVTVTSWDRTAKAPDDRTDDGRAYVRSVGGQTHLEGVRFSSLGFWSGRTGGVAVLGEKRSDQATVDTASIAGVDLGRASSEAAAKQQAALVDSAQTAAAAAKVAQAAAQAKAAGQAPGPAKEEARRQAKAEAAQQPGTVALDKVPAAGEIKLPDPAAAPGTASAGAIAAGSPTTPVVLKGLTVEDGAFGLYVSGVHDLVLSDSTVRSSRVDGVVLHRDVTKANLTGVRSDRNRGDGISVARGATQVKMASVTAVDNVRDGVLIQGAPLADGPNAAGSSTEAHGDTTLSGSTLSGNGRYGVSVVGGRRVQVNDNTVTGQEVGIVVQRNAEDVRVAGNKVDGAHQQGIAVRDGVKTATVEHNQVAGTPTGVYVRGSGAAVRDNVVTRASSHGLTVRGAAHDVALTGNTLSGEGPAALDVSKADGVDLTRAELDNTLTDWSISKPITVAARRVLAPLTVMWLVFAAIVVVTGIHGRRRRWEKRHPYADQMPLARSEPVVRPTRRTAARPLVGGS